MYAHAPEVLVASGAVAMDVGVDYKSDVAVVDLTDGRENTVGDFGGANWSSSHYDPVLAHR